MVKRNYQVQYTEHIYMYNYICIQVYRHVVPESIVGDKSPRHSLKVLFSENLKTIRFKIEYSAPPPYTSGTCSRGKDRFIVFKRSFPIDRVDVFILLLFIN